MATVSHLAWEPIDRPGFCACCGLRRPLGALNLAIQPGGESVRCIDCFFDPADAFAFKGTAVYVGSKERFDCKSSGVCRFGQTGDILWDGCDNWFEPHGDIGSRFKVDITDDVAHLRQFHPERYSVRVADDLD